MTVLLLDDDPSVRESLRYYLEAEGVSVEVAPDAYQGVHAFLQQHFDVVVTDLDMPGNGQHVLERVHALRPGTPVIIMTGQDPTRAQRKSLSRRAYAILPKPFAPERLTKLLRQATRRRSRKRGTS
jgi:DNA-binding NtrC family response regulator